MQEKDFPGRDNVVANRLVLESLGHLNWTARRSTVCLKRRSDPS